MDERTRATLLLFATLLAACGSGSKAAPAPATPTPTLSDLAAQEQKIRALARTGVRPELGSGADATFAEIDAARADGLPPLPLPTQVAGRAGSAARLLAAPAPGIGVTAGSALAGLFASLEPGIDPVNVNGTNGTKHVDLPLGSADMSFLINLTQSGSSLAAGITARTVYTGKNGTRIEELATGSAEIQLCPDAQGKVPFNYTFFFALTTPGGGVQIGLSGTGSATVNDDGQLTGWSSDTHLTFAAQGGAMPVTGADARIRTIRTWDWNGAQPTSSQRTVERDTTVVSIGQAIGDIQNSMPQLTERYILEKAQARWQNGACVEIVIEGAGDRNEVAPSSTTSFTGKVRHRFEGVELAAPISAALDGGRSLSPAGRTQAPVPYAYGAPDQEDQLASANLETRSRRGRAKKVVTFFTKALRAYVGNIAFSGSKVGPTSSDEWSGSAAVRLLRTSVAGGGATFAPDPAAGSVTLDKLTSTNATHICTLVGTASGGPGAILGGSLVLLTSPAQYSFTLVVMAQGTQRCVRKSDGTVTTNPTTGGATLSTSPGSGDPGFQPVTNPALLTGTAHFTASEGDGAVVDQDTSWSLAPQ